MKIYAVCALLLVSASWYSQAKTPLSVCYEGSGMEPFISADKHTGQPVGLLVDMLNTATASLDITLKYQQAPWLRCQKMVQENQLNATLAMIWSAQRVQQFRFPDHDSGVQQSERYLWQAQYPVFHRAAKSFALAQYLPQFGIGAPLGYIVEDWLRHKGWLSPYKFTPDVGLRMVADGKLDGYSVERFIGIHSVRRLSLEDKVVASDDNLLVEKWFLVFNLQYYQQNQQLVEQFWSNIETARVHLEARFPYPDSGTVP